MFWILIFQRISMSRSCQDGNQVNFACFLSWNHDISCMFTSSMYFFLAILSFILFLSLLSLCEDTIMSLERPKAQIMGAHFGEDLKWKSFCSQKWPLIATWPSASPCTTQSPLPRMSAMLMVVSWLGASYVCWFSSSWFFCCPFMGPKWWTTLSVTHTFCWHSPAPMPTSLICGQPQSFLPAGFHYVICFLHCYPVLLKVPQCRQEMQTLLYLRYPLHSGSLVYLVMCFHHSPTHTQEHGSVLWHSNTSAESTHLFPEKWRGKTCYERVLHVLINCRWIMSAKGGRKWILFL